VCAQNNVNGDLKGFWQKGDAANWTAPIRENSSAGVVYRDYPLAVDKIKADTQAAVAPVTEPQNSQSGAQNAPAQPLSREQIIAKHGAPDLPRAIRAAKDSPPEMQGLFEAINSGDKELAWQYSLALARRNTQIQKTVAKATDYQVLAMEALGMRAGPGGGAGADALNPNRAELQAFIDRTKAEQAKAQGAVEASQAGIAEAAGLVDAWADSPVPAGANSTRGVASAQAGTASDTARQPASTSPVPVDPAGKVKVLFFLDERDAAVKSFADRLRPLKQRFKDDSNVSMVGLTKRSYDIPTLKNLSATANFPFALLNGEALAQELQIHTYPLVVFVATTSKQTYRVEGTPSVEQIEQVIRLMKGSR
jgi:hypothetical protein